jgi:hypothetical protein
MRHSGTPAAYTTEDLISVNEVITNFFQLFINYLNEWEHDTLAKLEMKVQVEDPRIFELIDGCLQGLYVYSHNPFYRVGRPMIQTIEKVFHNGEYKHQAFIEGIQEHKEELINSINELKINSDYFNGSNSQSLQSLQKAEHFIKMEYLYADRDQLLTSFVLPLLGSYVDVMEKGVYLLKQES